ncbi:hypothetical protein B484DRAFT_431273, partial [Ochromonadaceae sp. CCMP2298]
MNDGQLVPETRAWSTARDQNTLNSREQTYAKKIDAIKRERGLVWTLLFRYCSSSVISAVQQEPTYAAAKAETDSLQLYLLMEKVCMKRALGNAEEHRTDWMNIRYEDSPDQRQFFNEFEEIRDNIVRSTGRADAVTDADTVFRLREALPYSISSVVLLEKHTLERFEEGYPTYDTCKKKVINYVCNVLNRQNREESSAGKALASTRESPDVYRGKKLDPTTGKCYNCDSPNHMANACPNSPHPPCDLCGKKNHTLPNCKFNKENPDCYPDIKNGTSETGANRVRNNKRTNEKQGRGGGKHKGGKAYQVKVAEEEEPIPGNYIAKSGTALSTQMDTEASEEEDKEDQEGESDQEIENTQVEDTDLAEENNATVPPLHSLQMHVTINGIVYETENMGALATLLRPYITRPTPAIPAPVIQIHAPDIQLNTTQAAYTDEEPQPKNPLAAATILQQAYDAKYSDTENTVAPTYADKLLATQSEMYRDARRTSCI